MARTAAKEELTITAGSGNVFADLGLEAPQEELARADLVLAISRLMKARRMTQAALAKLIGIDQPQVSKLLRGQTAGYSIERLSRILNQLGQDVEITIRPTPAKRQGHLVVTGVREHQAGYNATPTKDKTKN